MDATKKTECAELVAFRALQLAAALERIAALRATKETASR